ncbi:gamma-glutamylcyclotransferase family protein [Paenibacillus tarimensis]|uniref:gamma-glutamylcyclotransferase family protein n=1 Tax=Paenibacillus tarimensis TaxID=416012 RepID=UPI001F373834|nr:gamma-glutamylcyclotransferase family protein [Paenibacillus tarimensis]MCF2942917.1 gamma-glutamylcyclotransferase [Paenibacillus tarimensis]
MTEWHQVFIYGSLLPGLANHPVAAPYIRGRRAGRVYGQLVDAGAYPALIPAHPSTGQLVQGLWITVCRHGLAALDRLEEFYGLEECNDYERVWVRDAVVPQQQGWVYVWSSARGCRLIEGGSWPSYYRSKNTCW